ncbi:MAG: hypothetical protein CVU39_27365 [Chloroflexi bacterium HGW-Chloroflexi-10]|nr:MAG: hypothetical protein CVU39_27365 [Chloroflexi bacterium HGW-Chloroflexi-10]
MDDIANNYGLIPAKHPKCPVCGEKIGVIPILYGLPNLDAIQLESEGKLEIGSRFFQTDWPCWRCKTCNAVFGES